MDQVLAARSFGSLEELQTRLVSEAHCLTGTLCVRSRSTYLERVREDAIY
jgi:hypothetical protein